MMPTMRALFAALAAAALPAQTTWIVNSGGGPGVHFTDLQAAVAAAAHGDTILVTPDAFNSAYPGFTTDRGIAVVGVGRPRLGTAQALVRVQNLPAARSFRLAGFDAPRDQELRIEVLGCAGPVHLEDLHALEPGFFLPTWPSIEILNCALVTLHDVEDFGTPAVRVRSSTAVLTSCRLGETSIGLGGGPCLYVDNATVQVTQPAFRALGGVSVPAITMQNSLLTIGGTVAGYVQGGEDWLGNAAAAIVANGGEVRIDPAVRLNPFTRIPQPITGTAAVSIAPQPSAFVTGDQPGSTLAATFTAPAGSVVIGVLGLPAPPLATAFGTVLLQPAPLATLAVAVVPNGGAVTTATPVPAGIARGLAFAVQPAVVRGGAIGLGSGCAFVLH